MAFLLKITILLLLSFWMYGECLNVIPERAEVLKIHPNYVKKAYINVRRYSRKSPYYINLYALTEHTWGNNVTVDIIFSQYLHNEYRRSFIEFHYKLCDLINNEPFIGGMIKNLGGKCPFAAGEHRYMNMTPPTSNFKNLFPFEKGRVDITFSLTSSKELLGHLYLEALFKN